MYRTIIVALDLSAGAERAVPYGATLARQAGATLELLTVQPSHLTSATVRRQLADVARHHGVDARLRVAASHDVAGAIVETAEQPDTLLCLQTRARGPVTELVLGSVSEQVVRTSRYPVLLIGPHCGPAPERFTTMVVALDGSRTAEEILPVVAKWSSRLEVRPWLFQVLEARVPFELGDDDLHETAYVHRVADRLARQRVKADWDITHDRSPAAAIARFADSCDGSLIALTTQGRSGLQRLAMGSVALQLAHRATVPVLALRPAWTDR